LGESGPGVFGPRDEAADVNDDCDPVCELPADDIEAPRGDELLDEYACCGGGRGRDGNLSFTYNGRWGAL
jgi:hypothetical protein